MTTPENQNTTQELEPFFPPVLLLAVSAIAFVVAIIVVLLEGQLNILGYAGIAVGVLALIFWVVMNPQEMMNFVRGRGVSFGGTAIIITIVMMVAAVLVYRVVERQNWFVDFTEGSVLTIADNTQEVLEGIANDPTSGSVRLIGFFNSQSAPNQERIEILFREFETLSDGKITYEFVDPDRQPLVLQSFGDALPAGNVSNRVAVVGYNAEGNPLYEEAEFISNADQYNLTNTIITILADGDFRAVFLNVPEGPDPTDASLQGANFWPDLLRNTFDWTVEIVSPLELTTSAGLGDMAADGDVLVIPGGVDALPDDTIAAIQTYVDNGGNLILLAGLNLAADPTLAAADNMTAFLEDSFGVHVNNDIVVDDEEHFSLQALQLVSDSYQSHPITQTAIANDLVALFSVPQSIEVLPELPDNITVTPLITSTENAYSKAGLDVNTSLEQEGVTMEDFEALFAQEEGDATGPFNLALAAENTSTGSRLVVFGSDALIWNSSDGSRGDSNPFLMQGAIFWTTRFDDFASSLATVQPLEETPPDQVLIDLEDALYIRLVTVILIPFGSLLIGVAIWWWRRDRVTA